MTSASANPSALHTEDTMLEAADTATTQHMNNPANPDGVPNLQPPACETAAASAAGQSAGPPPHLCDFPVPPALERPREFVWSKDLSVVENYRDLGEVLARCGDLYRNAAYGDGLLLAPAAKNITPTPIRKATQLATAITDRVRVRVVKAGKTKGQHVPPGDLRSMLASESFLRQFLPVDVVVKQAHYLPGFTLTAPGYNDGGSGQRVLHLGEPAEVADSLDAITRFLDVMAFESPADRTNAVAAALTVLLRNFWHGGKPLVLVTSTKSHGGKDTVISFACGQTPSVSISYQATDWAMERAFVGAVKHQSEAGVVIVDNARKARTDREIASAWLERFLTDREPLLFSTGTGGPVRLQNAFVLAISTNYGSISQDLMNRALPIHLTPVGDVAGRNSPIGNPKLEYLPANRGRIEAELRGMVERWRQAGMPRDTHVKHPFDEWARTVGGILQVAGFTDFLSNYSLRKTADDPVRNALGLMGLERPDEWLRPGQWAKEAERLSLARTLIPEADRHSDKGCERGLGRVLSQHMEETFTVETEGVVRTFRLEKNRQRFEKGGEPSTRYRFALLSTEAAAGAVDDAAGTAAADEAAVPEGRPAETLSVVIDGDVAEGDVQQCA